MNVFLAKHFIRPYIFRVCWWMSFICGRFWMGPSTFGEGLRFLDLQLIYLNLVWVYLRHLCCWPFSASIFHAFSELIWGAHQGYTSWWTALGNEGRKASSFRHAPCNACPGFLVERKRCSRKCIRMVFLECEFSCGWRYGRDRSRLCRMVPLMAFHPHSSPSIGIQTAEISSAESCSFWRYRRRSPGRLANDQRTQRISDRSHFHALMQPYRPAKFYSKS